MNFNEPSAELDLAVAKAVGIEARMKGGVCEERCSVTGKWWSFRPSRDIRDAWEAAEKVGLFDVQGHQGALHGSVDGGMVVAVRSGALYVAPTAALAICAAIIGLHSKEHPAPKE